MIKIDGKKTYMVFNVEKNTDKNNRTYQRFSIDDSTMNPATREYSHEWWQVTTYSDVPLKNRDKIVIKSVSNVGAKHDEEKNRVYRSVFATIALPNAAEPVADFTKGEAKEHPQKPVQTQIDDDLLPF